MPPFNMFALPDLSLERSGGTLERRKGIYIAQLRGSYADMGRQHGELALAACGDVVPQYVNQLVRKLVAHTVPFAAGDGGQERPGGPFRGIEP